MTVQDVAALNDRLDALEAKLDALLELAADSRSRKEWYTTAEVAKLLGREAFTVREWARLGRVHASKRPTGRGRAFDWTIGHDELTRIRNEGLLPLRPAGGG